jgi:hypothetical protein
VYFAHEQAFVLVFTLMLVTVITVADYLVGHHLNSKLPFHIPESGVTMFIGMLLGAFISALGEMMCLQLALSIKLAACCTHAAQHEHVQLQTGCYRVSSINPRLYCSLVIAAACTLSIAIKLTFKPLLAAHCTAA